jgi:hypothetical protein
MEYALFSVVILALFIILGLWISYKITVPKQQIKKYRQSDVHYFLKEFFSRDTDPASKISQLTKRREQRGTKIIITEEGKAYWVIDNIFYVSDVVNGKPDFHNATPVDTTNMSKNELDKMLFILDNLGRGDKNERGSSGN